jgi:hypothetical protein
MKVAVLVIMAVSLFVVPACLAESMKNPMKIDMSKTTCKDLMSGRDLDREVGIAYYHGFLAGEKNNRMLDVTAAATLTDKVRDYCLSNPTSTVMDAFTKNSK